MSHECIRECTANASPKTCEYHFTVEAYHTLSKTCFDCPFNQTDCFRPHCVPADGFEKSILTVNRMVPGPAIQVKTLEGLGFYTQAWKLRCSDKDLFADCCYVMLWPALTWRGQEWAQHAQGQLLHTCIMQAAGSSHVMELLTDSI